MPPITGQRLGQLYRQFAPALRLYARQWPGGEDLVHDAFVRLAQQAPPPARVLPWLYRVVRNGALAGNRADQRRRRREEASGTSEAWFSSVDQQLDAQDAMRLLSELPLNVREIIIARIWGGLTHEEIAELVGCALATAHRRFQAGLAQLRERLEGPWTLTPQNPTT